MKSETKLWSKNLILMILATFPFYIESLGGSEAIAGSLISGLGYGRMFVVMSVLNVLAIAIYFFWAGRHPSSFSYRKKHNGK